MPRHPVVHFEIGCNNAPETRDFFAALFDWNIGGPEAGFTIETGEDGTIPGHIVELAPEWGIYVTVYVQVDDLEATLSRVEQMGLPIWSDIQLEGFVRKHCRDPFGNGIELLQRVESRQENRMSSPSFVNAKGEWQIGEEERN